MAAKAIFFICVQALLSQAAFSQCLGAGIAGPYGSGWGFEGLAYDGLGMAPFDGYGIGPFEGMGVGPFDGLGYGGGWPGVGCGAGLGPFNPAIGPLAPAGLGAYGGGLPIASGSTFAPAGLSVLSENVIEGVVSVMGQMPFLGTVTMEGAFPSAGAGSVSYGCGDGMVGIVAEAPMAPPAAIGPIMAAPGLGYGAELGPYGYGAELASYGYGPGLVEGIGYNGVGPLVGGCGCGAYY